MELSLRYAKETDWPAVRPLLEANGLPTSGAESHIVTFIVATSEAVIVGVAGAEVYGDVALVRSVAVAPDHHGRGIGETLIWRLLQQLKESGIRQAFLLTTTATGYFARFGFKQLRREKAPLALYASTEFRGACPEGAAFMAKNLGCVLFETGTTGLE